MLVEQYWTSVARMLQIEAAGLNGLVPHHGERGRANELTLARLLENLLPSTIGVGSGVVIDSKGGVSSQADLILYNKADQPQLIAQSLQLLFPIEVVHGVIEIKSRLTASDVDDVAGKVGRLAELTPSAGFSKPFFGVFAYDFGDSDIARAQELVSLTADAAPDLVCVINPGFFLEGPGRHGFVPLHRTDEHGEPIPGEWDDPEGAATVLRNGIEHPAFSTKKYAKNSHVGDPGRALLLFVSALLHKLGPTTHASPWLSNYLSPTAGELLWPSSS